MSCLSVDIRSVIVILRFRSRETQCRLSLLEVCVVLRPPIADTTQAISPFLPIVWISSWVYAWAAAVSETFLHDHLFVILMWVGVMFSHAAVCEFCHVFQSSLVAVGGRSDVWDTLSQVYPSSASSSFALFLRLLSFGSLCSLQLGSACPSLQPCCCSCMRVSLSLCIRTTGSLWYLD